MNLTTADISDSAGAMPILDVIRKRWPWIKHFFADGAYDRRKLLDKAAFLDFVVEVVRRFYTNPGLKVIPRPWVVERSIGWLTQYRRLVRDYERHLKVSEAMIFLSMGTCSSAELAIPDILKRTLRFSTLLYNNMYLIYSVVKHCRNYKLSLTYGHGA